MYDPLSARTAVRLASYPNAAAEAEAVRSVDEQVFDRVRAYERMTVERAQAFQERAASAFTAAEDLAAELQDLTRAIESGAQGGLGATAAQWDTLRNRATQLIAALTRARQESEWHAERAEHPYEGYTDLLKKYPSLRRPVAP